MPRLWGTGHSPAPAGEYKDCEGNQPANENYDSEKPCSDCDKADPLKEMNILPSKGSGVKGGLFGEDARKEYRKGSDGKYIRNSDGTKKLFNKPHKGYDIAASPGTPLFNMLNGKIVDIVTNHLEFGKWIRVESFVNNNKIEVWYTHLSDISVKKGDVISQGTLLGKTGDTGNAGSSSSAGPHLHIAIVDSNFNKIDPKQYLSSEFDQISGVGSSPCN